MKRVLALSVLLLMQLPASAGDLVLLGPKPLLAQGIAWYSKGNYREALKYLQARCRIQPGDPNAYYYLGNSYLQLHNNDEAAHAFTNAVKLNASCQAGQYSLEALERLSLLPRDKGKEGKPEHVITPEMTPEQVAATKEAIADQQALDKQFNENIKRVANERQVLKRRIDDIHERLSENLQMMNRRSTANYFAELAQQKSNAEVEVEKLQRKQVRWENRLLAPNKIDVRAVPPLKAKVDDSKEALGALAEYFKSEKDEDPLGTDITPEISAKFMTLRDVFGDLSTYDANARRLAKQLFGNLKSGIEIKQDNYDSQVNLEKERLVRDVFSIQCNYPNQVFGRNVLNPISFLTSSKIPRSAQNDLSPLEQDIAKATERTKKRMQDLQDNYNREVEILISGTKERLGGLIGTTAQLSSQWKKPHGTIQVVPLGTTLNNRNYINFGDRSSK